MKPRQLWLGLLATASICLGGVVGALGAAIAPQATTTPKVQYANDRSTTFSALAKLQTTPSIGNPGTIAGHQLCAGGMESDLKLDISPIRVTNNGNGDQLALSVEMTDRFTEKGDASLRYAVEIRDDAGVLMEAETISPLLSLPEKGKKKFIIDVPELPDGFYRCTVTAAARKKVASSELESSFYWKVKSGLIDLVDFSEWQSEAPFAGRAVPL